jgi:hypothetical protein
MALEALSSREVDGPIYSEPGMTAVVANRRYDSSVSGSRWNILYRISTS